MNAQYSKLEKANITDSQQQLTQNKAFKKGTESEISRFNLVNPDSFLHIFDYVQNKELKKLSNIEEQDLNVKLNLVAPDCESYSRLLYEIDQIERMQQDFNSSKTLYFDNRNPMELILFDKQIVVNDSLGEQNQKALDKIKVSKAYKKGKQIGEGIMKQKNDQQAQEKAKNMAIKTLKHKKQLPYVQQKVNVVTNLKNKEQEAESLKNKLYGDDEDVFELDQIDEGQEEEDDEGGINDNFNRIRQQGDYSLGGSGMESIEEGDMQIKEEKQQKEFQIDQQEEMDRVAMQRIKGLRNDRQANEYI